MGDRQGNQGAHLRGDQAHGLGRNFLQQVPCQDRIGLSQTKRPVRDHARRRRSFRSDPTGSEVPWRGSKDGRQDARPRHCDRRGLGTANPFSPAGPLRQGREFVLRHCRLVQPDRERKSSGSETTFPEDLTNPVQIEAGVIAMANDVWAWCEKANSRGRTVTVKIKWADFQLSTRSRSTEWTIQTRHGLHEVALDLIRSVFPPPKGVRTRRSDPFELSIAIRR